MGRALSQYHERLGARATQRADARLGVAVSRGLPLDLEATDDRSAGVASVERYAQLYASAVLHQTVRRQQSNEQACVIWPQAWARRGTP